MTGIAEENNKALSSDPGVPAARSRLDSIDLLRGCIMMVMALDHVREFMTQS